MPAARRVRRVVPRSSLMSQRWNHVSSTMITKTMNAIAAPVPYFSERNDSW